MHPILFTIPGLDYEVSSFGVMMLLGFLAAYHLTVREMPRRGIDPELGIPLLAMILVAGILGSKLYFTIDMLLREGQPWTFYFFRNDGLTWYGGLFGGVAAATFASRLFGFELKALLDAGAVGVAVGQALGRVGCFLAGDDYGVVTDLPWAVAFPHGAPPTLEAVHPTQLYEVAWLLPVAGLLHARRRASPFLFGEYLVANGFGRIWIEPLRVNPKVALGLTEPQWIGIALVLVGSAGWIFYALRARRARAARKAGRARP